MALSILRDEFRSINGQTLACQCSIFHASVQARRERQALAANPMHVITRKRLNDFAEKHADAISALAHCIA